jgi:hypothetical protein
LDRTDAKYGFEDLAETEQVGAADLFTDGPDGQVRVQKLYFSAIWEKSTGSA